MAAIIENGRNTDFPKLANKLSLVMAELPDELQTWLYAIYIIKRCCFYSYLVIITDVWGKGYRGSTFVQQSAQHYNGMLTLILTASPSLT